MDANEREELKRRFDEIRFMNIDARITALENEFISYTESEPKSSDQWQEARLRALEAQVKQLTDHIKLKTNVVKDYGALGDNG